MYIDMWLIDCQVFSYQGEHFLRLDISYFLFLVSVNLSASHKTINNNIPNGSISLDF